MKTVLVVAGSAQLRGLARHLAGLFELLTAEDADAAGSLLAAQAIDVALVDVDVAPGAVALCRGHHVPVIARGRQPPALAAALAEGAVAIDTDQAPELTRALLERAARAEPEAAAIEPAGDDQHVVAYSPAMRATMRSVRAAGATRAPVVIVGEPGTGRSFVARRLHQDTTDGRPLHTLWPADLEHEQGAERLREAARAGDAATLVVEHLDALGAGAQALVVAELEERAGSRATTRTRIVGTATPDARERARRGELRRDLLAAFPVLIEVPPLRQRADDLPMLAQIALTAAARRLGRPDVRRIGTEAMRALRAHPWSGQVPELVEVIDHAVLVAEGPTVIPSNLPFFQGARGRVRGEAELLATIATPDLFDLPHAQAKARAVMAFDAAYAAAMLVRSGGNISVAARAAGLDRSNFKRLTRRAREPRGGPAGGADPDD